MAAKAISTFDVKWAKVAKKCEMQILAQQESAATAALPKRGHRHSDVLTQAAFQARFDIQQEEWTGGRGARFATDHFRDDDSDDECQERLLEGDGALPDEFKDCPELTTDDESLAHLTHRALFDSETGSDIDGTSKSCPDAFDPCHYAGFHPGAGHGLDAQAMTRNARRPQVDKYRPSRVAYQGSVPANPPSSPSDWLEVESRQSKAEFAAAQARQQRTRYAYTARPRATTLPNPASFRRFNAHYGPPAIDTPLLSDYAQWRTTCDTLLADKASMHSIPALLACYLKACPICLRADPPSRVGRAPGNKDPHRLCIHALEKFYRTGVYTAITTLSLNTSLTGTSEADAYTAILRKERNSWHPDKFFACAPDVREAIQEQATNLFVLADELKGRDDAMRARTTRYGVRERAEHATSYRGGGFADGWTWEHGTAELDSDENVIVVMEAAHQLHPDATRMRRWFATFRPQ